MARPKTILFFNEPTDVFEKDLPIFDARGDLIESRERFISLLHTYRRISAALRGKRDPIKSFASPTCKRHRARISLGAFIKIKKDRKRFARYIYIECKNYFLLKVHNKNVPSIRDMKKTLKHYGKKCLNPKLEINAPSILGESAIEIIHLALTSDRNFFHYTTEDCLKAFKEDEAIQLRVIKYCHDLEYSSGNNEVSMPELRAYFCKNIGKILNQYDVCLKNSPRRYRDSKYSDERKGGGGTFFRILSSLFEVMGDPVSDLYPLLKTAIAEIKANP